MVRTSYRLVIASAIAATGPYEPERGLGLPDPPDEKTRPIFERAPVAGLDDALVHQRTTDGDRRGSGLQELAGVVEGDPTGGHQSNRGERNENLPDIGRPPEASRKYLD